MGDRRVADRREKETGVIKIKFEDAVKYAIVGVILTVSIVANIILAVKLHKYIELSELYVYDEDVIDEEVDIDELMNTINSTNENIDE